MQADATYHSNTRDSRLMRCQWGTKLALLGLCVGALLLSAGCEPREDRLESFDGAYFRAKASPVDKKVTLADFTTTVWGVSKSLDGARKAGGYEGTKYCIAQYGTSRINWSVGPDTPVENLRIIDDTLSFAGRCDP